MNRAIPGLDMTRREMTDRALARGVSLDLAQQTGSPTVTAVKKAGAT
jgi:hypothetical protein